MTHRFMHSFRIYRDQEEFCGSTGDPVLECLHGNASYLLYYHVLPGKQHNPPRPSETDYSSPYKHTPSPPTRGASPPEQRWEGRGGRDLEGFIFTL